MGKSNIPFFGFDTVFSITSVVHPVIIIGILAIGVKLLLDVFLKTKLGFVLSAVGDNEQLVTSLGLNKDIIKVVGLSISNGIAALGGSIMAQHQGYADIGMGTGTVVVGLAAVILGGSILGKIRLIKATTMALIGAILYKLAVAGALKYGLQPQDLKLVTALIVIFVLAANNFKFGSKLYKKDRKGDEPIASAAKSVQSVQ
jgi:putative ABC transport system permease protein